MELKNLQQNTESCSSNDNRSRNKLKRIKLHAQKPSKKVERYHYKD